MYLGMCISNNDPEMRGRVQIFIPHIMPTVYEYGDESADIEFSAVGDNITGGLRTEIVEKLKAVLPWAESASPIVCSSTPGALIPGTNQAVATPTSYPSYPAPYGLPVYGLPTKPIADTQTPSVSSAESTAPAQSPIPAAQASQTETSGLSSGSGPLPFIASPGIKALLAAIALGESSFSSKEANKNDYNLVGNNANVRNSFGNVRGYRPANQDIAVAQQYYGDYGFFQNNDQTEGATVEAYLLNTLRYPAAVASYYRRAITNDVGKGNFSLADQSRAMVFYLEKTYPTAVQALGMLDPSDPRFESKVKEIAVAHNIGKKWFGLDEGLRARAANPNSNAYKKINGDIPVDATNSSARRGIIASTTNTNPYGPVNYIDTNDRPRGTFAIPAPGAMLWVFFREGNPQFPVFFATSFSQKEWAASGVYNSGGAQTYTNSGAGQMISTDILTPEGVTHSAFTVGGGDTGSNLSFAPDHTSLYSAMSFRQDTMHDSFHVIGGNHEQKVYGESSHTVFGDRIRRVGTFTDEAYEAANQLWAQVKETNDTLAQPS